MTNKWLGPANKCEVCDKSLKNEKHFIDGKTRYGLWALMCRECHKMLGCGIGTGKGQVYSTETMEKVAG